MALAHAIGNKVEAAYRRGDLFEKRRRLMAEWAKFCARIKRAADGQGRADRASRIERTYDNHLDRWQLRGLALAGTDIR